MKVIRLFILVVFSLLWCCVSNAASDSNNPDVLREQILTEGNKQREIFCDQIRNIPDDHMLTSDTELFCAIQNIANKEPNQVDIYLMLPEYSDNVLGEGSSLSRISSEAFSMSLRVNALPSFQDAIWLDFSAIYSYSELCDWRGIAFVAFQYEADDPILLVMICNDGRQNAIMKTAPLYCDFMDYLKMRLEDQIDVVYGISRFRHDVVIP